MRTMLTVYRYWLALPRMPGLLIILLTLLSISAFTYSLGQVKTTGFGDTIKGNVKLMTEYNYTTGQLIIIEYTWDTIANTSTAIYYDEKKSLRGKSIVTFDSKNRLTSRNLYCHDGKLCTQLNLQYNKQDKLSDYHYVHYSQRNDSAYMGECNGLYDWLHGQITYWMIFDSSVDIRRYEYDLRGRVAKTEDINILDGDSTIKLTEDKYDSTGNKTESKTLTNRAEAVDTMVEIVHYRYYDSGAKYVEETIVSYSLGHERPDTTVDGTRYIHYTEEELYNSDRLSEYANKEYDQQGNIISIPSLFRREIEYY